MEHENDVLQSYTLNALGDYRNCYGHHSEVLMKRLLRRKYIESAVISEFCPINLRPESVYNMTHTQTVNSVRVLKGDMIYESGRICVCVSV